MADENSPCVEELRRKLQDQLKQSGMDKVIKRMVEDVCASKDDPLDTDPEEVLETIYSRGLMDSVLGTDANNSRNVASSNVTRAEEITRRENYVKRFDTGWLEKLTDSEDRGEDYGKARRFYLKVELKGTRAFLDHLSHGGGDGDFCSTQTTCKLQKLKLHIFFKSQRFYTKPVDCQSDPLFRDSFVIDVGPFGGSVANLLSVEEPLRILIIREDTNLPTSGGGVVISSTLHDWRSVLLSDNGVQSFSLELMGVGPEINVPIGLLNIKITILPCPDEQISQETFLEHIHSENTLREESARFFVSYAKQWMNEFLSIRPGHVFRNVKLFAFDETLKSRPIISFVQPPLNVDRVFPTPFYAAWFVSLFYLQKTSTMDAVYNLQTLESIITSKSGTLVDLSVLLCSLLLGFGLNAFVALGCDKQKVSEVAWVVTFTNNFSKPLFWDPRNGKRYIPPTEQSKQQLGKSFKDAEKISLLKFCHIFCLFNNQSYFCNIQPSDSVQSMDWTLSNPTKWKPIPPKIVGKLSHQISCPIILLPSSLDCDLLAMNIEIKIQELLEETRAQQGQLTRWDGTTSKLMGQQLATCELKASTGGSKFDNFFEAVIMRSIPEGYDFKGYHYHNRSLNAKNLFDMCMRDVKCQEVVSCRGEDVRMSLRVAVFPYPENVTSLRLMIGCRFMAVDPDKI